MLELQFAIMACDELNILIRMKPLVALFTLLLCSYPVLADIQDPPQNDYGPTRKLGRGLSNIAFGATEIPESISQINDREGNSAALGYGLVRGLGRALFRVSIGVYEVATFPSTYNGTYKPPYISNIPWIHGGFEEFPPELGFETRFRYTRENTVY